MTEQEIWFETRRPSQMAFWHAVINRAIAEDRLEIPNFRSFFFLENKFFFPHSLSHSLSCSPDGRMTALNDGKRKYGVDTYFLMLTWL